ncbi:hypothetical protein GCK32_003424 [Trichostrongylus colubriformis]|uniref:Uncharacterized protein n=1 Tax=Trichostrongylus colubriformis TaxID=6319 RepID=A0AAN8FCW0_TRICO
MRSSTDTSEWSGYSRRQRRSLKSTPAQVSGGQLFFEFDAPEAFISPQLFAVNPRGDMIYSVKIDMKLTLDPDTQEVVVVLGSRSICRCSIHTGKSISYVIDNDISANELREASDFYLLSDNIGKEFERFLWKHDPDLHIFAAGILAERNGLTFLLKSTDYELFETTVVGRATYGQNGGVLCRLIPLDNSSVLFSRLLCIRHLRQVCHRESNIWMTIISSDFAQLNSWKWKIYLSALLYIIKVITLMLRFVLWLRRVDRGVSLYLYMRLLRWLYGPSMIPVTAPPPAFNMYGLDMKSLKFRRVPIKPKLYTTENTFVSYPLAIDCDRTGGVVTAELGSSLKVNYFPSQNTPLSLCKLAEHSVYRHFPAFEKSPLLRRSVGQLNWDLI